jgi:hypothetical protein
VCQPHAGTNIALSASMLPVADITITGTKNSVQNRVLRNSIGITALPRSERFFIASYKPNKPADINANIIHIVTAKLRIISPLYKTLTFMLQKY